MRVRRRQAIAFVCSPDGLVLDVLLDELDVVRDMAQPRALAGLVDPPSRQIARNILLEAQTTGALVAGRLRFTLPRGSRSLFVCAHPIAGGIILFCGTARP